MGELVKNSEFALGASQLSKGFGADEFDAAISAAVKGGSRQNKWTKKKSFAPSGVGYGNGTCPRYWYYAFNGAEFEYDTPAQAIQNMDAGTAAGERIAGMLDKAGLLVKAEEPAELSDPPIFGYIDAVVNWKGEEIIGEVKTTKQETWNYRAVAGKAPGYQLIQLLIYMYIKNKQRGFFLVENKNDHGILIFPVRMTEENKALVERVFDWMRTVKKNADDGELPTRPFTKSSIPCKGCPVKSTCWEGWTRGKVNGTDPNPGNVTIEPLEIPK